MHTAYPHAASMPTRVVMQTNAPLQKPSQRSMNSCCCMVICHINTTISPSICFLFIFHFFLTRFTGHPTQHFIHQVFHYIHIIIIFTSTFPGNNIHILAVDSSEPTWIASEGQKPSIAEALAQGSRRPARRRQSDGGAGGAGLGRRGAGGGKGAKSGYAITHE